MKLTLFRFSVCVQVIHEFRKYIIKFTASQALPWLLSGLQEAEYNSIKMNYTRHHFIIHLKKVYS